MTAAQRQVIDIGRIVDERRFGAFHVKIMALCFLAMAGDGYDLMVASLAGPGLVQSWHIDKAALGPLFSASLLGMLFGGPSLAYVGDRFGRRPAIMVASIIFGVCSLAAAFSGSLNELIALRFVSGLGLAGLMPNCIALNAEFAPRRIRARMIVLMHMGTSLGATLPAAVTAILGPGYRWETLFLIGGIFPLAVAVLLFLFLPESAKFLVVRKQYRERLVQLMSVLRPGLAILPDAEFVIGETTAATREKVLVRQLFSDGLGSITLLLWVLNIIALASNYFLHGWMPIVFRDAGLSTREMGVIMMMFNVGGLVGGLVVSASLDRLGIRALIALFALACPLVGAIGTPGLPLMTLAAIAFSAGFCIVGMQLAMNASAGLIYPTAIRATGGGWQSAIGRFGATLGPLAGGWLIAMHVSGQQLLLAPVLPLAFGVVAAFVLMRICHARFAGHRLGESAVVAPGA